MCATGDKFLSLAYLKIKFSEIFFHQKKWVCELWCLTPLSTILQLYRGGQLKIIGGGNPRPVAGHRQTLSHNVVTSTPRLDGIRSHNVSSDRY